MELVTPNPVGSEPHLPQGILSRLLQVLACRLFYVARTRESAGADFRPCPTKKELLLKRNSSKPRSESGFSSSLRIYFLFFLFLLST